MLGLVIKPKLSPGRKSIAKNTMKIGSEMATNMQIFPNIREKSLGPTVKKCSRLVLVKNTLQPVMENWEKRSKAEFQNSWLYIVPCTKSGTSRS